MNSLAQTELTTVFKVRLEMKASFSEWQEKMNTVVATFPGFISLEMSPLFKTDELIWINVQRFRTSQELDTWHRSEARRLLLEEVKPLLFEEVSEIVPEADLQTSKQPSVTEVFVTNIKPGKHKAYQEWASKIQQIEAQFLGYRGVYLQAPNSGDEKGKWITILHFDTSENLDAWLNSTQRKEILKESESFVEDLQSHRVSAFSGWFGNISKQSNETPAVWKQTMLVLLVLFPIVMLEMKFLNPWTRQLNPSLATFIGNAISVSLVSWPLIPITIYYLDWWLAPGTEQRIKKTILGTLIVLGLYVIEVLCFWRLL